MSDNSDCAAIVKRGRPALIARPLLIEAILNRKLDVLQKCGRPVSKVEPLWQEIADALNNKVTAATLYSFVADNKDDIKNKILGCEYKKTHVLPVDHDASTDNSEWDQTCTSVNTSMEIGLQSFRLPISKKEFSNLLCEKTRRRVEKDRDKVYERTYTTLKSGLWQEYITNTLWQIKRIKCGFNFRSPQISRDGTNGSLHGTCHCGSIIEITLIPGCENDQIINTECRFTPGTGKCEKRYLRQPIREEVANKLCTVSASVYRADQARKMMKPGDPEPGTLYKTTVMNKAKHESNMKKHDDPDTFVSLGMMKRESQKLNIHAIGYDPFYLLYWTNYQIHVYRLYARSGHPTISIDATGSIVHKLTIDNRKTKHIFLYQAVVNCHLGQFPVTQMLSERHDTVTIHMWLERWVQAGVPVPKEVISDSCKALLNAIVRTFSVYKTIEEYADASWKNLAPRCYVRLDVSHFIKMYVNFLGSVNNRVRVFYLSSIGQLIMARSVEIAADIVKAILIVARSESDGNDTDGSPTPCELQKKRLQEWIPHNSQWTNLEPDKKKSKKKTGKGTMTRMKDKVDEEDERSDHSEKEEEDDEESKEILAARNPTLFDDTVTENSWKIWGDNLNKEAKSLCKIEGDRANAHYMPKLADRLLKDIRWLPLWSCILRDRYGYGRVPASSAPSESDFNYVKTHLLKKRKPVRADEFVELQISNINGRMVIADAKTVDISSDSYTVGDASEKNIEQEESETNYAISCSRTVDNTLIETTTAYNDAISFPAPEQNKLNDYIVSINKTDTEQNRPGNNSVASDDNSMKYDTEYEKSESEHEKIETNIITMESKYCTVCELCKVVIGKKAKSDGDDESRDLCETCIKLDVDRIFASREEEDWRGQTSQDKKSTKTKERPEKKEIKLNQSKKSSKYLAPNQYVLDAANHKKSKQIPILRNGGHNTLKGIKIGIVDVTLINTCAFDSILQVLLVIQIDEPTAAKTFETLNVPMIKLAHHIGTKGITSHAYKQRAIILFDWYKKTGRMKKHILEKFNNNKLKSLCVNCDSNAAGLASILFYEIPSASERSYCKAGCTNKQRRLITIVVRPDALKDPEFENVLINHVTLSQRNCSTEGGCKKSITTAFTHIGNFVILELYDHNSDAAQNMFALGSIPKKINNPLGENELKLKGVINYIPKRRVLRKSEINYEDSGHYTAFCLRPTGTWIEYNDVTVEQREFTDEYEVDIHAIIYFRP